MTPTSGARSGTPPSRPRPAGSGITPPITLRCGHELPAETEPVAVFPGRKRRYWCEECRTLKNAK